MVCFAMLALLLNVAEAPAAQNRLFKGRIVAEELPSGVTDGLGEGGRSVPKDQSEQRRRQQ
jgi:hypothetical protein